MEGMLRSFEGIYVFKNTNLFAKIIKSLKNWHLNGKESRKDMFYLRNFAWNLKELANLGFINITPWDSLSRYDHNELPNATIIL